MNKGIGYALGAYLAWGFLPVYWKWLQHVPAPQVISHRLTWSLVTLVVVLTLSRQWSSLRPAFTQPRILLRYALAGALLGVNWLIYIWAVNAGYVVETSLGYFINPLVSVLLGVLFLRERLRRLQWVPVGLAALGVLYLTVTYGSPPWIALALAVTFGIYGLVKKTAPLGSLPGLALETGALLLPALGYLLYADSAGQGAFLHAGPLSDLLLAGTGITTTLPLLLFASAARRIPLSLIGLLQYIAPSIQFLLGVLVYHEPFDTARFIGFGVVWTALVLFAAEGLHARRLPAAAAN